MLTTITFLKELFTLFENFKKSFPHAGNLMLKFSFLFIRKYAMQNPGIFINLPFTVERQDLEELCLLKE